MGRPLVSVIISNSHPKQLLLLHAHILCCQTFPTSQYEVFLPVFDKPLSKKDLPSKEELTFLHEFEKNYPHFQMLFCKGNRDYAINQAAKIAKGKWLIFTESHCIMDQHWLEQFWNFLEKTSYESVISKFEEIPSDYWVANFEMLSKQFERGASYFDFHQSAILRERYLKEGGLREDIPAFAEFEIGARLHNHGVQIGTYSASNIFHKNQSTLSGYMSVVLHNGKSLMKSIMVHDRKFCETYFSTPFIRLWKSIRPFRLLFIGVAYLLIWVGNIGFRMSQLLHNKRLACFFFFFIGKNTHRLGSLQSLKKEKS